MNNKIEHTGTLLWKERINIDPDFFFFKDLHTSIVPAVVYKVCKSPVNKLKTEIIASIWVSSITLVNEQCSYCNITYTEYLSHIEQKYSILTYQH